MIRKSKTINRSNEYMEVAYKKNTLALSAFQLPGLLEILTFQLNCDVNRCSDTSI